MFLAIDESMTARGNGVWGGLLLSDEAFKNFEADFLLLRLKHKIFGEVKWAKISSVYLESYLSFVDLFFDTDTVTFHAFRFRLRKQQYNAAYTLIRQVTWKLENSGINEPLWVLFDKDGALGAMETKKIREFASVDRRFKQELAFCEQGSSHVLGCLQVADILTGAMRSSLYGASGAKKQVYDYILNRNEKPLDWAMNFKRLPSLYDHKIHYFDADKMYLGG